MTTGDHERKVLRVAELAIALERGGKLTVAGVAKKFKLANNAARESVVLAAKACGAQVQVRNRTNVWSIPSDRPLLDLPIDPDLAAALSFAVEATRDLEGTPHHDRLTEVATLALHRLPEGQQDRQSWMSKVFHPLATHAPMNAETTRKVLHGLWDAILRKRVVSFNYAPASGDAPRDRTVDPWCLVRHDGRILLVAGRHDGASLVRRHYHLEGISDFRILDGQRARAAGHELDHAIRWGSAFGIWHQPSGEPVAVELVATGPAAVRFAQRSVHRTQVLEPLETGVRVRMRLIPCPEFEAFLLGLIPHIRVVAPCDLRARLEDRCRIWMAGSEADHIART